MVIDLHQGMYTVSNKALLDGSIVTYKITMFQKNYRFHLIKATYKL